MARPKLSESEKKQTIQVLIQQKKIEKLGGKKECAKICAEFLEAKANETEGN